MPGEKPSGYNEIDIHVTYPQLPLDGIKPRSQQREAQTLTNHFATEAPLKT